MPKIIVDFTKEKGKIKPLHSVNNGPIRAGKSQTKGNFDAWTCLGIPYARNHDAAFCSSYGGEHTVDVVAVFPDFDADVNSPDSYDFILTDEYLQTTLEAGTKIFYRLGNKIEHWKKKYGVLPPKDFEKWAEICEHIIMHYNEGWANGFHFNVEYWEIWNEPDLMEVPSPTWGGTEARFFDLYEITSKRLKKRFPNLKIGGPALAYHEGWAADFLSEMKKRNAPLDFFSWHFYGTQPSELIKKGERLKAELVKNGYTQAQSICNEFNYMKDFGKNFISSIETIISVKGAAFTASCLLAAQSSSIDMLMYYDARPSSFNGMFDFYTMKPIKGYYVFYAFNKLYEMGTECQIFAESESLYAVAAKDGGGSAVMIAYYNDDSEKTEISVDFDIIGGAEKYEVFLLDNRYNLEKINTLTKDGSLTIKSDSVLLLTEARLSGI